MASKHRNIFYENKKQETMEIVMAVVEEEEEPLLSGSRGGFGSALFSRKSSLRASWRRLSDRWSNRQVPADRQEVTPLGPLPANPRRASMRSTTGQDTRRRELAGLSSGVPVSGRLLPDELYPAGGAFPQLQSCKRPRKEEPGRREEGHRIGKSRRDTAGPHRRDSAAERRKRRPSGVENKGVLLDSDEKRQRKRSERRRSFHRDIRGRPHKTAVELGKTRRYTTSPEKKPDDIPDGKTSGDIPQDPSKLPVVSIYSGRHSAPRRPLVPAGQIPEDMRLRFRKSLAPPPAARSAAVVRTATQDMSPSSRLRVDRLVKRFGPEVLPAALGAQLKDNHRKRPRDRPQDEAEGRAPSKKRMSLGDPLSRPPHRESNAECQRAMDVGGTDGNKKLPPIDIHLTELYCDYPQSLKLKMASKRRNMFYENKRQETTEIALFAAVEHCHVEKAKTILESTDVDVNGINSDGLSPLDVAVLNNNRPLIKMLLSFGAQEGNQFSSGESLVSHLREAQRICELSGGGSGGGVGGGGQTGGGSGQDVRNQSLWQRRAKGLHNMMIGFTQARPPDIPSLVAVDVTGSHTVLVRYREPDNEDSPVPTKYRIEWSTDTEFRSVCGCRVVLDPRQTECAVDELRHGDRYHFRVACGNIKGWGHYRQSTPQSVIPSSWRDVVTGREVRCGSDGLARLDRLFAEVRTDRPDLKAVQDLHTGSGGGATWPGGEVGGVAGGGGVGGGASGGVGGPGAGPTADQRRKKTTIKQLFTAASKFQKHLRRGVYLSCLLYHEDKVMVTSEDFLPVIEVDETYPSSIYHDFHWLLKVACTWDDVKWLRQDMEKSLSSSAIHFRIKLLQAAAQMQTALSVQDLGQLYHKPLRDTEGTIVISTVNYVRSPKAVSVLNSRWVPLGKLNKRTHNLATDATLGEILMASIPDQITYHQVSSIRLPRGLYLGYLKMRSSVELLQVLVPAKAPNVLPHCKIRDNPHITAEEWEYLTKRCGSSEKLNGGTELQRSFVGQVAATANRLLTYMQVSANQAQNHRVYDAEVVEISSDVSLLVVVPPPESACSAPGQGELLLQRSDLIPLPVQVFEMVHLGTYHSQLVARYSRLSCILELDTALAQHSHREAFSNTEVSQARERLSRLEGLQAQLNSAWKQARWLLDVLAFARDKATQTPTDIMRHLLAVQPNNPPTVVTSNQNTRSQHNGLLQPPDPKAVKSRGSWPGPGVARLLGAAPAELSRSEHQLSTRLTTNIGGGGADGATNAQSPLPPQLISPATTPPAVLPLPLPLPLTLTPPGLEPGGRLPPSRSEDTLVQMSRTASGGSGSNNGSGAAQNKSSPSRSSVSATTSPLLPIRPGYASSGGSMQSLSPEDSAGGSSGSGAPATSLPVGTTPPGTSGGAVGKTERATTEEGATVPAPAPGILQVYAAYETGLAAGTSLKLHVSPRTTAREVVDLVVKQLNMAVVLKGKTGPVYPPDRLQDFCLVAVIGARERCLRDDFKPLQLQNPWKKGRLYVRQKQDVLAALEQSSRHSAFL